MTIDARMSTPSFPASRGTSHAIPLNDLASYIVCISTDVYASAALQTVVAALLPEARVEAADTSIVRGAPDADCVILAVGHLYSAGVSLVRELRARRYERPIILVVESPANAPTEELTALGASTILAEAQVAHQLPGALLAVLTSDERLRGSSHAAAMITSLRRLQASVAAGQMVRGMQHQLNNPLAALLAEAQLMELDSLSPEHLASVRRMVELCRRVIEVTRSIHGIGDPGDDGGMLRERVDGGQ